MSDLALRPKYLLAVLLLFASLAYSTPQRSPKPLRPAEILALVAGRSLPVNIVHEITVRGLAFRPTVGFFLVI